MQTSFQGLFFQKKRKIHQRIWCLQLSYDDLFYFIDSTTDCSKPVTTTDASECSITAPTLSQIPERLIKWFGLLLAKGG